jgi:hypothetical protein
MLAKEKTFLPAFPFAKPANIAKDRKETKYLLSATAGSKPDKKVCF